MSQLPAITFSPDADEDTLWSVLNDWSVTITTADGDVVEGIVVYDGVLDNLHLLVEDVDYDVKMPANIVSIEVS